MSGNICSTQLCTGGAAPGAASSGGRRHSGDINNCNQQWPGDNEVQPWVMSGDAIVTDDINRAHPKLNLADDERGAQLSWEQQYVWSSV
mmetsp:Transcript_4745/g.10758  ORF Transcript_4745/g.10758 Transcript_4745/m.10758 type:complete len:89 (-) Transcript_4745:1238-1504(-)